MMKRLSQRQMEQVSLAGSELLREHPEFERGYLKKFVGDHEKIIAESVSEELDEATVGMRVDERVLSASVLGMKVA